MTNFALPQPHAIVFDFFETLVEVDRDMESMASHLCRAGYDCSDEIEAIYNTLGFDGESFPPHGANETYENYRMQLISRLCRFVGVPEKKNESLTRELLRRDACWTVKAKTGAKDLLEWLACKDLPFVICTNWDYELDQYLLQAGLSRSIPIVTSRTVGVRKPAGKMFETSLKKCGVHDPAKVWFVGDSWKADVVGAIRFGFYPIYLHKGPKRSSHVTQVKDLVELHRLFDGSSIQNFDPSQPTK